VFLYEHLKKGCSELLQRKDRRWRDCVVSVWGGLVGCCLGVSIPTAGGGSLNGSACNTTSGGDRSWGLLTDYNLSKGRGEGAARHARCM